MTIVKVIVTVHVGDSPSSNDDEETNYSSRSKDENKICNGDNENQLVQLLSIGNSKSTQQRLRSVKWIEYCY
jgi:hypothetical protein